MILMFYTRDKFIKHLELDMSEEFKLFLEFCIIHIFKINWNDMKSQIEYLGVIDARNSRFSKSRLWY